MSEGPDFLSETAGGVCLRLQVTPKASRQRIEGLQPQADGASALKVSVTAAPEGGKANAAVIKLLAKDWRLPKSAFSVRTGAASRHKLLFIEGDAGGLARQIREWVKARDD